MDNTDAKANKKRKLIIKISAAAVICIALAVFLTLSFQPQPLFKDKAFLTIDIRLEKGIPEINEEEIFEIFKDVQTQLTLDDANAGRYLLSEYPIAVHVHQMGGKCTEIIMGEKDSYIVVAGLKSYLIDGPELYKKVKEIADKAEIVKEIKTPNYSAKYE